ncbi:amino acid ABC transporter substrate-binding protein [Ihubacter massiliensis]|uniref:Amino acid ABC transporter substrate-binding protein n=1 Tax=Hominibacterium faecale TaxID=2839743 RepID=A0A9J6QSB3_9FIRM|nr:MULTISPECIES: amino acid ABC transporter substrate-binding protein [Eubacteriales Family XIII. Incertae Sedis]MCC2865716.1 amino acid ABC transporter substrate-binding protein [Anaerovorax odorimutans]MCI7304599.1 amino acid ABC transporter substrate-binding protein [Clostridia bacterium]MDE8732389.1 amino acid ABC transporter substrate-binding protein [Eubacteriales bacterium DFI.9.88]MDY3012870.1 amino acid ABC transporter substrate-binding protein [Clostridiales Family XIII bacterium]MCO
MKKKLLLLAAVLVLVVGSLALTGCGGSDKETADDSSWEYVQEKGELIVGLDDTFAPMGFRDESNNLVGFDIDLATAVCKELGVKVKFQPINWDSKDMELTSKNIDCIWNGMSITPERIEGMSLSNKYLNNKIIVMTLEKDVKVAAAEDMAKYKIGTQVDSAALETMKKNEAYDSFKDNITEYKTYDEALMDMQAGRVDCIVVDQVLGEYKNSKLDKKMTVCDFNFGDDFYAIGFRKDDKALTAKVNEAIKATIDSGEAEKISDKWFGKNIVIFEELDK